MVGQRWLKYILVPAQEDWGYIHGSTVRILNPPVTKTLILSQWKGIDVTLTSPTYDYNPCWAKGIHDV